ncbi:MAG TPA: hypothetical protein VE173_16850 [Longimicrobiales bacterium]|nr:hypothetical protein [Longimicrobiales bacterium]
MAPLQLSLHLVGTGFMISITGDTPQGSISLEDDASRVSNVPMMGPEKERALFAAAGDGEASALHTVVAPHLRFVVDQALERRGLGGSPLQVIQAGNRAISEDRPTR